MHSSMLSKVFGKGFIHPPSPICPLVFPPVDFEIACSGRLFTKTLFPSARHAYINVVNHQYTSVFPCADKGIGYLSFSLKLFK